MNDNLLALPTLPLASLTDDSAIQLCKETPQIAGRLLIALLKNKTSELPDTAFVKRGPDGHITKRRMTITLAESRNELVCIKKAYNKNTPAVYTMSIDGIRKLNTFAALQPIKPDTVMVDGEARMNPYIQVDPDTKMPEVVYARCLAVGYSPTGDLVATNVMIRLDLNIYFIENIQSKMKELRAGANNFGIYGTKGSPPDKDGSWVYMPIHRDVGLWVNMGHASYMEVMKTHTTKLKFIERLAQSFAERNAFKAHPAIPSSITVVNGIAKVTIDGWTSDFDRTAIDLLVKHIESDTLNEFVDPAGKSVEVKELGQQDLDGDDMSMNIDAMVAAEEDRHDDNDDNSDIPIDEILSAATEAYGDYVDAAGKTKGKDLLKKLNINVIEEASIDTLSKLIEEISVLLDRKDGQ